jgi:hypothetical protein
MTEPRTRKPTVAELESILAQPDPPPVTITAAGEVVAQGLREAIMVALSHVNAENGSNTPDYILADYLVSCLAAFDRAVLARERWYGYSMHVGMPDTISRPNVMTHEQRAANYQTHKPRYSDSSLYDAICTVCGAKDYASGPDELSDRPCKP